MISNLILILKCFAPEVSLTVWINRDFKNYLIIWRSKLINNYHLELMINAKNLLKFR